MTPEQRGDARISLAMLPIGVVLVIASVIGIAAVFADAVYQIAAEPDDWGWHFAWCGFALVVGTRNLLKSLETMSALDVAGTMVTLGWSAAIVVAWPGWWLG